MLDKVAMHRVTSMLCAHGHQWSVQWNPPEAVRELKRRNSRNPAPWVVVVNDAPLRDGGPMVICAWSAEELVSRVQAHTVSMRRDDEE